MKSGMLFPILFFLLSGAGRQAVPEAGRATPQDAISARSEEVPVVLRFGGDCLMAAHYEEAVGDDAGYAFRDFSLLKTADIAMLNLECPVTLRGSKIPKPFNFRMKPGFLHALPDAGVTLVNIANNHIFDYGREGLFDTISYLDSVGLKHVGAGRNAAEAYRPVVLSRRGIRIGFLGFYGGGEAPAAGSRSPGVARRDLARAVESIRLLRSLDSVDVVIVNLHWGTELATAPDPGQREFAHRLIDAGADAVIGHHPHVLQGIERYGKGVIVYSLGNFLFGGNERSTYTTGLFEMRITRRATGYRFLPVQVRNWRLSALSGTDSAAVLTNMSRLSSRFRNSIFNNQGDL